MEARPASFLVVDGRHFLETFLAVGASMNEWPCDICSIFLPEVDFDGPNVLLVPGRSIFERVRFHSEICAVGRTEEVVNLASRKKKPEIHSKLNSTIRLTALVTSFSASSHFWLCNVHRVNVEALFIRDIFIPVSDFRLSRWNAHVCFLAP